MGALQVFFLCLFAVAAPRPPVAEARVAEKPSQNAALQYWQAIAQFSLSEQAMDAKQREALEKPLEADLEDRAIRDFMEFGAAFRYLHSGAAMDRCDWQIDMSGGPATFLFHTRSLKSVNGLLCLRARYRFEGSDPAGAVDDLTDAMVVARHTATDGTLVSLLVGYRNEAKAAEVLAYYLPAQSRERLEHLAVRLDALPEFPQISEPFRAEKKWLLEWARRNLKENGADALRHALTDFVADSNKELQVELAQSAKGGKEHLVKLIDETGPYYDEAVSILELPLEKFVGAAAEFGKELDEANPIARAVFGGKVKSLSARYREAEAEARLAMLKAAVAVVREGREAVERFKDPFGDGPYRYTKTPDGFVLESALRIEGKPFWMTFGGQEQ